MTILLYIFTTGWNEVPNFKRNPNNAEHAYCIGFRTFPYKFQNQITQLGKAKPSITQQQWVLQETMDFSIQILPGLPATKQFSYYF